MNDNVLSAAQAGYTFEHDCFSLVKSKQDYMVHMHFFLRSGIIASASSMQRPLAIFTDADIIWSSFLTLLFRPLFSPPPGKFGISAAPTPNKYKAKKKLDVSEEVRVLSRLRHRYF